MVIRLTPNQLDNTTERRVRLPYIGKPRFIDARGRLSFRQTENHRGQIAFAGPRASLGREAPSMRVWTRADQFLAVTLGFALERVYPTNRVHVRIVRLTHRYEMFPHWKAFSCDLDVLAKLERSAFRHPGNWCYWCLEFIRQQDKHGYSNAWEDYAIEVVSSKAQWFHEMVRERTIPKESYKPPRQQAKGIPRKDFLAVARETRKSGARDEKEIFLGCYSY